MRFARSHRRREHWCMRACAFVLFFFSFLFLNRLFIKNINKYIFLLKVSKNNIFINRIHNFKEWIILGKNLLFK
jgi:hypothetical protein